MQSSLKLVVLTIILVMTTSVVAQDVPPQTPTSTETAIETPTTFPTFTPEPSLTPSMIPTLTETPSPLPAPTETATPSATETTATTPTEIATTEQPSSTASGTSQPATLAGVVAPQITTNPLGFGSYEETNPNLTYSGIWQTYLGAGPRGGSMKYSNDPNATVSFSIADDVQRITVYRTQNTMYGPMTLFIRNAGAAPTLLATIPGNGPLAWQLPFTLTLPAGTGRTVELRNTSTSYIGFEAFDLLGAITPFAIGSYEETHPNLTYSGIWQTYVGAAPRGGSMKYSNDPNAAVSFSVVNTAERVIIYRTLHSRYGPVGVYVDGSLIGNMPTNMTLTWGAPYVISLTPNGNPHTIELRNTSSQYIGFEAFDVRLAPAQLSIGSYEETNIELTYSGTWLTFTGTGPVGGSMKYSNDPNATVQFTVDGSAGHITIYRTMSPVYGAMGLYVNGTLLATIPGTSSTVQWAQAMTIALPGSGARSIELRNASTSYIGFEAFVLAAPTTPTATVTNTATATLTRTPTTTPTNTAALTATATLTPSKTATPFIIPTMIVTSGVVPTFTFTPGGTITQIATGTAILTPSSTRTATVTPTPTLTPTFTVLPPQVSTPTSTFTPTATASPTFTPTVPEPTASGGACSYTIAAGDVAGLVSAVNGANANPDSNTICLTAGAPYTFSNNLGSVNNYPYMLPPITSPITIEGNNAILTRTTPGLLVTLFLVNSGGNLIVRNLSLPDWYVYDTNAYFYPHTIELIVVFGQATLQNVSISNAPRSIAVETGGALTINNSNFTHNLGVVLRNNGTTTLTGSTFRSNQLDDSGGAAVIANSTGTVTVEGSSFIANIGSAGGAIYNHDMLSVTNSRFIDNRALSAGGAIYQTGLGITTVTNSVLNGNAVTRPTNDVGSAIEVSIGSLNISNSCIINNPPAAPFYYSIEKSTYADTVNVTNNWWGSARGPNQPGSDTTNATTTQPFLTAPILGCPLPPLLATDITLGTSLNTGVSITLLADGGALPYSYSTTSPAHGVVSGTTPNLTYTPNTGFTGLDTFSYTVTDGAGQTATATVRIHVGQPIAANIIVNSTAQEVPPLNNGNCTLGEAIRAANLNVAVDGCAAGTSAKDIILLQAQVYEFTQSDNVGLQGANGLPVITSAIHIRGNGAVLNRNTATAFRFMEVTSNGALTLENMTLQNGSSGYYAGGAVYSQSDLTIQAVTFNGNRSAYRGGAINNAYTKSLNVADSIFNNNDGYYDGGAIAADRLTVSNSQFNNNHAGRGGAIFSAILNLRNSTFTSNRGSLGAAIYTASSDFNAQSTIDNSIFDGNIPSSVNGLVIVNASAGAALNISNSTIKNTPRGVALYSEPYNSSYPNVVTITNSCITGNADTTMYRITNATNNWWGAFDGPGGYYAGGGDKLPSEVSSYLPFLTAPPAGCDILPPIALEQTVSAVYQQPTAITLTAKGGMPPYTFAVATNPANGTLSGTAPNLVYTPNVGFRGTDSFTFTARNSTGQTSSPAKITINMVTDLQATNQTLLTAFRTPINFTLRATGGVEPYTFSDIVLPNPYGVVTGTVPNLTYTPTSNFSGTQYIQFKVTDAAGYTRTGLISIQIAPPLTTTNQHWYAPPQIPVNISLVASGGISPYTYTLLEAPTHGVLTGTAPTLTYVANAGANGSDRLKYTISDSTGASVISTITLFSGAQLNANTLTVYTALNTPVNLPVGATGGAPPYTIQLQGGLLHGGMLLNPPYTYTPYTGYFGTDQLSYLVTDANGFVASGVIVVSVGVRQLELPAQTVATAYQTPVNFAIYPSGGAMPYAFNLGSPTHGVLTGAPPNALTYTPNTGYSGTETITATVTDQLGVTKSATITFTVYPQGTVSDVNGLIAAINAANANPGPDTITLSFATFVLSDIDNSSANGPSGLPVITDELTIRGIAAITRAANAPDFRFFEVASGVKLTLDGLDLVNGVQTNASNYVGGAIYNAGDLTLNMVNIYDSSAYQGGAVYSTGTVTIDQSGFANNRANYGGALFSGGTLTISNSVFSSNNAFTDSANFYRGGMGGALLAQSNTVTTISNTTFEGNTLSNGGTWFPFGGAGLLNEGTMTISNSRFINNTGFSANGGAIRNGNNLTVIGSTFSGNKASSGGAILSYTSANPATLKVETSTFEGNYASLDGGGIYSWGALEVKNSTFSANIAGRNGSAIGPGGGSIAAPIRFNTFTGNGQYAVALSSMKLFGNILTNNNGNNCYSTQSSEGYNISDDTSCGLNAPGDQQNVSVALGPLTNNGGPTDTHLPYSTAVGADLIPVNLCAPAVDQRGVARPVGAACDAGSVERNNSGSPPVVMNLNSVADTGDGTIAEGELIQASLTQLLVRFDRAAQNPAGNNQTVDVTNPATYRLIGSGINNSLQTNACAIGPSGDDISIPINGVTFDNTSYISTLLVNGGTPLPQTGFYRLLVCAAGIRDMDNRPLDGNGDGVSGDDFARTFTTDISQFRADVSLTVVDSPDPVVLNNLLTYTITVSNTGPQSAQNVVLTSTLPSGVTFVSVSDGACSSTLAGITCNLGIVVPGVPGSTRTITLVVRVNGSTFRALTNMTSSTSTTTDPNPGNNTNIQTVTNANEQPQTNLVVNTTSIVDDGLCGITHCSLPEAVAAAAMRSGPNTVTFNLPGSRPYIIRLQGGITISDATTIDGRSQPGYAGVPIIVLDGSSGTTSGPLISGDNNVVQGLVIHSFRGSQIAINLGNNNRIVGNYIGTDGVSGKGDTYGIYVDRASNNIIGGTIPANRNIISGNDYGIYMSGFDYRGNVIQGNYIGTNLSGTQAIPNRVAGIYLQIDGTTIGGTTGVTIGGACTGACNLISGNEQGVYITGNRGLNTIIQGNFIGTDVTGRLRLGNTSGGIFAEAHSTLGGLLIGGASPAARNVISANGFSGVYTGGANSTNIPPTITVQGNYIGLDTSGTVALGNLEYGLRLRTENNVVIENVVSDNRQYGIEITFGANTLYGNRIGTNAAGTAILGQQLVGVILISVNGTIVGGPQAGQGNVIAGSSLVALRAIGRNIAIQGNSIGMDLSGTIPLGNSGDGIIVVPYVDTSMIGGLNPGEGNIIAHNGGNGISVAYATYTYTPILGNSIFANGGLGIDLLSGDSAPITPQVTLNDVGDLQPPQNFPVITSAVGGSATSVTGTLNSKPNQTFQIEVFVNNSCDASGYGEGQMLLGRMSVTTNNAGNGVFNLSSASSIAPGKWITATATDSSNNTSEFSPCQLVGAGALSTGSYEETNPNLTYSGIWQTYLGAGPRGGSMKYSNDPNATVSFSIADDVQRITVYRTQNTMYGPMALFIRNAGAAPTLLATIPGNGPLAWQLPFTLTLPAGTGRTIELRNTSTSYIGFEAFDLLGAITPFAIGSYEETNPNLTYSGNWLSFSGAGPKGGSLRYSNDPTATIRFRIDNTVDRLVIYRTMASMYGPMGVYVDGSLAATIPGTNASVLWQQPYTIMFTPDMHTIEIRNTSTNYIGFEAFDLLAPSAQSTATPSPTATLTLFPSATGTATFTPTSTPTMTRTPTSTPTRTPTPTLTGGPPPTTDPGGCTDNCG